MSHALTEVGGGWPPPKFARSAPAEADQRVEIIDRGVNIAAGLGIKIKLGRLSDERVLVGHRTTLRQKHLYRGQGNGELGWVRTIDILIKRLVRVRTLKVG